MLWWLLLLKAKMSRGRDIVPLHVFFTGALWGVVGHLGQGGTQGFRAPDLWITGSGDFDVGTFAKVIPMLGEVRVFSNSFARVFSCFCNGTDEMFRILTVWMSNSLTVWTKVNQSNYLIIILYFKLMQIIWWLTGFPLDHQWSAEVGSGKTTLLQGILGEVCRTRGTATVRGRWGCPEGWNPP